MSKGFTLLEVMLAVAILGVSLTAIFSSEVGAMKVAHRSRKTSSAALLARCKMGEIEELILNEGLPAVEKSDIDECCEDAGIEGFECDWKIERIVLPELSLEGEAEDGETIENAASSTGSGTQDIPSSPQDLLDGGGDIGGMAMQLAFPILKPHLEEQVRRATVTVQWKEGSGTRSFDVVQFLVAEQPAPTPETEEDDS